MPQSRKRKGHAFQKPADIPATQRTKGRYLWALLFGIFGFIMAWFGASANYIVLVIATLAAGIIGYIVGKKMEQEAGKKN
jgi:CHASE2 domain-containing sensor protein